MCFVGGGGGGFGGGCCFFVGLLGGGEAAPQCNKNLNYRVRLATLNSFKNSLKKSSDRGC